MFADLNLEFRVYFLLCVTEEANSSVSVASDQSFEYDVEISVIASKYLFRFPKRFLEKQTLRIDSKFESKEGEKD